MSADTADVRNLRDLFPGATGILLLNFWAKWSVESQKQYAVIIGLAGVLDDKDKVVHIDWDLDRQLAHALGVLGIPTLLIFIDGHEVARYSGAMDRDGLLKGIMESKNKLASFSPKKQAREGWHT